MKIIDASVEDFVEGLTQGQIIRRNGIFLMVTDLTEGALNYTRLMLGIDKESIVQLAPYLMGVDANEI